MDFITSILTAQRPFLLVLMKNLLGILIQHEQPKKKKVIFPFSFLVKYIVHTICEQMLGTQLNKFLHMYTPV